MRILLCSNWFSPSIGGVETVSQILAEEFVRAGHSVTVITESAGDEFKAGYRVLRQPSPKTVFHLARESDIVFQNLMSLKTLLPSLLANKPVVITHQSWLKRPDGTVGLENRLKKILLRACSNISISHAIAAELPVKSVVIGNPFEPSEFGSGSPAGRTRDIVFLGRLVSDKGCDVLMDALGKLREKGLIYTLTVIGDGDQNAALKSQAEQLGLFGQVIFKGAMTNGRGDIVAQHKVMAVPSRWAEPFGIVALEGIAAGCAVVASMSGGLTDAVGPCGLLVPNGDSAALAAALEQLLSNPKLLEDKASQGTEHLKSFLPSEVAKRYLEVFDSVVRV